MPEPDATAPDPQPTPTDTVPKADDKQTSRPDQPLAQRPKHETTAPSVGGDLVVDRERNEVTQTYSVPGTPLNTPEATEDDRRSAEAEQVRQDNTAPTGVEDREANRPLAVSVQAPEVNYATRDNIVVPDPRPGVVARIEAVAERLLGRDVKVEADATDVANTTGLSADEHRSAVDEAKPDAAEDVEAGRVHLTP